MRLIHRTSGTDLSSDSRDFLAIEGLPLSDLHALLDSAESDGHARWQQGNATSFPLRARSVALLGAP